MATLKVTSKGQVTLRREVLDHLGAQPGDRLSVEPLPGGRVEVRRLRPAGAIASLFGRLHRPDGPVLSVAQMNAIIADGWAGRSTERTDADGATPDDAAPGDAPPRENAL